VSVWREKEALNWLFHSAEHRVHYLPGGPEFAVDDLGGRALPIC
jgi:hypothetical protein